MVDNLDRVMQGFPPVTKIITSAQILTLTTKPIVVVPYQGQVIVPVVAFARSTFGGQAYSLVGTTGPFLSWLGQLDSSSDLAMAFDPSILTGTTNQTVAGTRRGPAMISPYGPGYDLIFCTSNGSGSGGTINPSGGNGSLILSVWYTLL